MKILVFYTTHIRSRDEKLRVTHGKADKIVSLPSDLKKCNSYNNRNTVGSRNFMRYTKSQINNLLIKSIIYYII